MQTLQDLTFTEGHGWTGGPIQDYAPVNMKP